jgi:hypothetical protein
MSDEQHRKHGQNTASVAEAELNNRLDREADEDEARRRYAAIHHRWLIFADNGMWEFASQASREMAQAKEAWDKAKAKAAREATERGER